MPSDDTGSSLPFDWQQSAHPDHVPDAVRVRQLVQRVQRLTGAVAALGTVVVLGVAVAALSLLTQWLSG